MHDVVLLGVYDPGGELARRETILALPVDFAIKYILG